MYQYTIPNTNTKKFWSDRKSRFTDILDPKKDTIKHDCFWVLGIECWVYRNFSMPVRQKSIECLVLGIESFECWVLNVGYTIIFPMPSQAKKYECWVLGIGHWVLGIEQFTVIFQYPVSQKHRMYQFFSNTQWPKFKDRPGIQPFDC